MKTRLLLFTIFCFMIIGFQSCSKDEDFNPEETYENSYFNIPNAEFIDEVFPSFSDEVGIPIIRNIYGNNSVIAGGSNFLTLESESDFSYILIGIEGITGYYKLSSYGLERLVDVYQFYLSISQDLQLQNLTFHIAILNSGGLISDYSEIEVSQIEAGTGLLQISCTWDQENDVDLHLIEPSEEEIYYGNSYSENGGELDVDSNAGCYIDGVNNENITYSNDAIVETGEYIVGVDLYSNCSVSVNTNFIVTAYYDGELLSTTYGTNPYVGTLTADDSYENTQEVMKFNISSNKSAKIGEPKLVSFKFPSNQQVKVKNLSPNK